MNQQSLHPAAVRLLRPLLVAIAVIIGFCSLPAADAWAGGSSDGHGDDHGHERSPLTVSPQQLDFGAVTIGTSDTLTFTVTNHGSHTVRLGGELIYPFSVAKVLTISKTGCLAAPHAKLKPWQSCVVTLTFSPTTVISATAWVYLFYLDPDGHLVAVAVKVTGSGVQNTGIPPTLPETPYAALLPVGAVALFGGFVMRRRRRAGGPSNPDSAPDASPR